MGSLNKAVVIGHLGTEPDLNYTDGGSAVCNVTVATNENYTTSDGREVDETEWHDITCWGRLAEIVAEHLSKGDQARFEGKIQTSSYTDDEGVERYSTEIKADEVLFLGDGPAGAGSPSGDGAPASSSSNDDGQAEPEADFEPDDELPF